MQMASLHRKTLGVCLLGLALSGCAPVPPLDAVSTSGTPSSSPSPSSSTTSWPSGSSSPAPTPSSPTAPAAAEFDCTPPTATVIDFPVTTEDVADVAHDTVVTKYAPRSITARYTNRSANAIDVDYVTAYITWRMVPHADRNIYWASPFELAEHVNGSSNPPQRLESGESAEQVVNLFDEPRIITAGGGLKATATVDWEFVNHAIDAVCRLGPLRTIRVGAVRDDAPFDLRSTRVVAGATLADVKTCGGTFGDSVLDVSSLWAVTVSGTRVNVTGSENAQAKAAGAGRLKVPVAAGSCRTTTAAFLTREKVTFILAPGTEDVPWRWKL